MALIYNATFDSQTRVLSLLDKAGNVISSCEVPSKEVDDITKPLTFRATQDGSSVRLLPGYGSPSGDFQTSRDGGNTWADYTIDTAITLNIGDEVSFRAKADRTLAQNYNNYFQFKVTGEIEAWHNVMSLYRTNDFSTYKSVMRHAFFYLFYYCQSLTKAPVLPATTLADSCYDHMFAHCDSLTKAPALPATKLADYCYYFMLYYCPSLKEVRVSATKNSTNALTNWLSGVSATGDFYCDPSATIFQTDKGSGIPKGWSRFVLGAEDTGNTTAMYHNGSTETVMIGTSGYGVCYALQGWSGFKTLSEMHVLGYTFGTQSSLTMYHGSDPVSAYSCDANIDDGFPETMYDVGDGKGYLDIATQNANGYTLTAPNP